MDTQSLQILVNIHNALFNISTKGEDTLIMAECLNTLKSFIYNQQEKINNENKEG